LDEIGGELHVVEINGLGQMTKSSRSQNHSHLLRSLLEEEGEGLMEQALKQKRREERKPRK
jgi:hypothetical protein